MKKEIISKIISTLVKVYQQYRLVIFPIAVVLSNLVLIVFIIYPQTSKLVFAGKIRKDTIKKSEFLVSKVEALESFNNTDLSQKVEYSLKSFPSEKDLASVMGILKEIMEKQSFNILSLRFGQGGTQSGSEQSYTVSLEILGPRALMSNLLNNIESSPRIMRVDRIEISTDKGGEIVNVNLGVNVLFSPLPQSFGTTDSPLAEFTQKDEELISKLAQTSVVLPPSQPTILGPRGKANPFE